MTLARKYPIHGAGVGRRWNSSAVLFVNCRQDSPELSETKHCMEDENQRMFLTIWGGGRISYRFWPEEADGSELPEQGTAAVAAAAATATAQLFSI